MQNHVKVYFQAFNLSEGDFIRCENCSQKAVDIHHIEHRSKFGKKTKHLQDLITNLIALCRPCHDEAHRINNKEQLTKKHLYNLSKLI